jgi:L-threonylcarbamoyladenylate synthase
LHKRPTQVWQVDAAEPDPEVLARAAAVLRAGGLVAFPTETVYGLGANAFDPDAVHGIFAAKGRPARNPVIVHVGAVAGARELVTVWPETAGRLAERFWPGPLTLVLPRTPAVPDVVTGGGPTVAVRCPAHPVALALVRAAGVPVAAPSANRSSELSPTLPEHVLGGLAGRIDLLLDAGPTPAGIESTVLDLSSPRPRLLRPGPISPSQLEEVIGPVERFSSGGESGPLLSPGLLARHYAPRTPLECFEDVADLRERYDRITASGRTAIVLLPDGDAAGTGFEIVVRLPADPEGYARLLYRVLHEADAGGADAILAALPPAADGWLAVRDRLLRAATPEG